MPSKPTAAFEQAIEQAVGFVTGTAVEMVPLGALTEHPRNPNLGDTAKVQAGIQELGFWGALIVQRSTNYILAGNTRYRALVAANYSHAPVLWADVDDKTADRILLADNRLATFADTDQERLGALLQELAGEGLLMGTGYTELDLTDLMKTLDDTPMPDTDAGLAEPPPLEKLVILLEAAQRERVSDWLTRLMDQWGVPGFGAVLDRLAQDGTGLERRNDSLKTERMSEDGTGLRRRNGSRETERHTGPEGKSHGAADPPS